VVVYAILALNAVVAMIALWVVMEPLVDRVRARD